MKRNITFDVSELTLGVIQMGIFNFLYRKITSAFVPAIIYRLQKHWIENGSVYLHRAFYTDLYAKVIYDSIEEQVQKLKRGLDEQSIDCLESSIRHLLEAFTVQYIERNDYSKEQWDNVEKYNQERKNYSRIILNPSKYSPEVFYYHHGLRFCNEVIRKYVANKVFLDCGAYVGDSAIILPRYNPLKIYSYEFSKSTIELFQKNIYKNHLTEIVQLFPYALGNVNNTVDSFFGNGEGCSIMKDWSTAKKNLSSFEIKRVDDCIPAGTPIGFIKADVEGALMSLLMGAEETIVKNRPVLSLAPHHSPSELFDSKPYLESILSDYVYEYHHFNFSPHAYLSELNLFAYPKELVE